MSEGKIEKNFYTVKELADLLGISRISVFKRVKQGSIKGQRLGRNFIILKKDINLKNLFKIVKTNKSPS
jgi:excisionase family DNA binding protein